MATDSNTTAFNLVDPETYRYGHPFDVYDRIRAETPVYRNQGTELQPPFWVLTRHADIRAVSTDAENFSSLRGPIIPQDVQLQTVPRVQEEFARFFIAMDDPEHKQYRNVVAPAVTPKAIKKLEERISSQIDQLVEGLKGRDEVDFVSEVAAIVPIKTVAAVMGVPEGDEGKVLKFTNAVFGFGDPELTGSIEEANDNLLEVIAYGWDLAQKRREDPQDDVMTMVAHATIDGEPLNEVDQTAYFTNMISAGNETTRSSLAGAVYLLGKSPDQRQLLVDDPGMIKLSLDELLRRHTPGIHMARTAKHDVEVGGQLIPAGERVALLYGAGNHDPAVFEDPYRLDLQRPNARDHLAFGYGVHHCLGWRLGTLQLRLILTAFLKAFPNYEIAGEPTMIISNLVNAAKEMRVRLNG